MTDLQGMSSSAFLRIRNRGTFRPPSAPNHACANVLASPRLTRVERTLPNLQGFDHSELLTRVEQKWGVPKARRS